MSHGHIKLPINQRHLGKLWNNKLRTLKFVRDETHINEGYCTSAFSNVNNVTIADLFAFAVMLLFHYLFCYLKIACVKGYTSTKLQDY